MTYDQIVSALGPCGLNCEKCFAHVDGDIRKYSLKLKEKLGNFDVYAKRFETFLDDPIFQKYPEFKLMLDYFASCSCKGCQKEICAHFKHCGVKSCSQQKKIDFCFECDEFPCNKTNFDEHLHKRWIKLNERIREIGIENYYAQTKDKPRYA